MTPIEFLNSDECPNLKNGMGLNEIQISIIAEIMQAYTEKQLRIGSVVKSLPTLEEVISESENALNDFKLVYHDDYPKIPKDEVYKKGFRECYEWLTK